MKERKKISLSNYLKEGEEKFGKDRKAWKFKCVKCGTVQSYEDFKEAGVEEIDKYLGFSCIGRFNGKTKGCDWTLGGLFQIHTLEVEDEDGNLHPRFEFA